MMRECGCRANSMEELAASSRLRSTPEQIRAQKEAENLHKGAVGLASAGIIALSIPASIWNAFVTLKVWRWFAEPLGAPHLTMIPLMGLWLLVTLFHFSALKSMSFDFEERINKSPWKFFKNYCWSVFSYPTLALLLGYIYTLLQ